MAGNGLVGPVRAGTFSLLPAQNATGNWIKVVQRAGAYRLRILKLQQNPLRRFVDDC